jgi:hypothetical protein
MKDYLTIIIFNIQMFINIISDDQILYKRSPYLSSIIIFFLNIVIVFISVFKISIVKNVCSINYYDNYNIDIFLKLLLFVFILFIIFMFFTWNKMRMRLLNKNDIDKKYIKFTAQAKAEGTIRCFSRNLSYLGNIIEPNKCKNNNVDSYRNIMLSKDNQICKTSNKDCKNICGLSCAMVCRQFTQLQEIKNNIEKLEILCVEPNDKYSKALLGKLVYSFGDKFEIRFYNEEIREGIYMFARIIITDGPSPMIWHWKVGNKYSNTQEYQRSGGNSLNKIDVLGDTLFYMVKNLLWDSSHIRKADEKELRNGWLKSFYDIIGLDENERKWEE